MLRLYFANIHGFINFCLIQDVKKKCPQDCLNNILEILEGWDIFHWKLGFKFTSEVQKFLYNIRNLRHKQIQMVFKNIKRLYFWNLLSWNLMFCIVFFIFWLRYVVQKWGWVWNMPKEVTFETGDIPAFQNLHRLIN